MAAMDFSAVSDEELVAGARFPWWEAAARKETIVAKGQPCSLRVGWMGRLLIIEVHPEEGWVSLIKDGYEREIVKRWGVYHVSLGHFDWDTWTDDQQRMLDLLAIKWDGWRGRLPIEWIPPCPTKGYLKLACGELRACPYVHYFHSSGSLADIDLHISA